MIDHEQWEPNPTAATRIRWSDVVRASKLLAEPGLRHLAGTIEVRGREYPIEQLEWRDEGGRIRAVATWKFGSRLFIIVDAIGNLCTVATISNISAGWRVNIAPCTSAPRRRQSDDRATVENCSSKV